MEDKEKYLINIAKEKTYQNQFDEYHKEFSEWRSRKDNPYGYSFVHDLREHTYVDGEGYSQKTAVAAERTALTQCLGLLGATMLVMLFFDAVITLIMYHYFHDPAMYAVHYSELGLKTDHLSALAMTAYGAANLVKYLVGFAIFIHFTKIPLKIAVPTAKGSRISKSGIYLILVIMVIGRVGNYLIHLIFGWINMDCVYSIAIHDPNNILADAIFVLFNCILVSILSEILFRGAILQTFRQFGDTFALIVSSIAFSLTFYDISTMGYAALCSAVLGLFTLQSGSLKTTIIMRITTDISNYALTCVLLDNYQNGQIVVCCIYSFIVIIAAFVFTRLICNGKLIFHVQNESSALTNSNKVRMLLTNTYVTIWLVAVLAMYLLIMRFI